MFDKAIKYGITSLLLGGFALVLDAQSGQGEEDVYAGLQGVSMAFLSWDEQENVIDFQVFSDSESGFVPFESAAVSSSGNTLKKVDNTHTYLYTDIYENIDLIVEREHNYSGKIKVRFVLFPGANPDDITFDLKGWIQSEILDEGTLQSESKWGWFFMNSPRAYQEYTVDDIVEVETKFDITDKEIRIQLEEYEKISSLTIEFDMEWIPETSNKLITAFKSEL